mmetsp:Transcript_27830/g.52349  ORF Transcript_27830/g.52349 Transcript_27830/m.52349 type:complete len:229 (+) Transcript_27830:129-815(+)
MRDLMKEASFENRETTVPTSEDERELCLLERERTNRRLSSKRLDGGLRSQLDRWFQIAQETLVIYPHKSTWLMPWEVFLMGLLLVTAFYEPVILALSRRTTLTDTIFHGVLDFSFITDMVLAFLVAFKHSEESSSEEVWEKDFWKIAQRYTAFPLSHNGRAGWFWLDLAAVLPGLLELILQWVDPRYLTSAASETTHVVRVFRFLRLIRMLRMVRLTAVVEKWHARYG